MLNNKNAIVPCKTVTLIVVARDANSGGRTVNTVLKITQAEIDKIDALRIVCEAHELCEARSFASVESWGRNRDANDLLVTQVELVVYPTGIFYLTGEDCESDQAVDSHLISIHRLREAFSKAHDGETVAFGDLPALQTVKDSTMVPA